MKLKKKMTKFINMYTCIYFCTKIITDKYTQSICSKITVTYYSSYLVIKWHQMVAHWLSTIGKHQLRSVELWYWLCLSVCLYPSIYLSIYLSTVKHLLFARTLFSRKFARAYRREIKSLLIISNIRVIKEGMKIRENEVSWIYQERWPRENKVTRIISVL